MNRDQMLEQRRREQAAAIKRKLEQDRHKRVRECLQWWADNEPKIEAWKRRAWL